VAKESKKGRFKERKIQRKEDSQRGRFKERKILGKFFKYTEESWNIVIVKERKTERKED